MSKVFSMILVALLLTGTLAAQNEPLRLGVSGLTHTHVHWILGRKDTADVQLVGIVEPNKDLAQRYADQHGFSMDLVFDSLEEMIQKTRPQAVAAFGTIYQHLEVVETCAPKGIHVMVEKPLAVNLQHARKMEALSKQYQTLLLTNYETSWYPTNEKAFDLLKAGEVGELRKVVIRDGHKGPKKIGVNQEFLEWLTDPVLNGGGALMDFGCYGANLMTWLQQGERPLSVTAVTQQLQAENNPKVDDDATILVAYKTANATIQASWNWPIGRKDMEVYGEKGAIYADDRNNLRIRISEGYDGFKEQQLFLEKRKSPYDDPFTLFAALINNEIKLAPYSPYTLENNMIVMEILQAASESAKTGRTVIIAD